MVAEFLEAMAENAGHEPVAVQNRFTGLDSEANRVLHEYAAIHGVDMRDALSGAVFFAFTNADDTGATTDREAVEQAKARRLHDEQATAQPQDTRTAVPAISSEGEAVLNLPGIHRFTFDYPATARTCAMQRTIEVSDEQMSRADELAVVFGLTPVEFLRALADHNHLPSQARRSKDKLRESLKAEHIAFVCMDETMAKRIERAADTRDQTSDEFVAESLSGDVDMWEENMLLHPTTGALLEADFESLYTEVHSEMLIPPHGYKRVLANEEAA